MTMTRRDALKALGAVAVAPAVLAGVAEAQPVESDAVAVSFEIDDHIIADAMDEQRAQFRAWTARNMTGVDRGCDWVRVGNGMQTEWRLRRVSLL